MKIKKITLTNFRGFKKVHLELHENCNVIIGVNGTGKTALLEGLKIAIGSLMLGMDKVEDRLFSPGIDKRYDVHVSNTDTKWPSEQFPVVIEADGEVLGKMISWARQLSGLNNNTTIKGASSIHEQSRLIQKEVQEGKTDLILPLISFYNTDRFKINRQQDAKIEPYGSRLRGYYGAMNDQTNLPFFLRLFRTETLASLQEGRASEVLSLIERAIMISIPECKQVYHYIQGDELAVKFDDERILPFKFLSDGIRVTMALIMEISFRCYLLNFKKLGIDCLAKTTGVVLIDEIDLHLHPSWQKRILNDLSRTFPGIQFIVTTHAPMVIGGVRNASVFALRDNQISSLLPVYGKDANNILVEMGTEERAKEVKEKLDTYFLAIENGRGKDEKSVMLRLELEKLLGGNSFDLQRADVLLSLF
jgi:predicted ATP-binding protein involved in virulence